jgi:Nudix hydrolase domain
LNTNNNSDVVNVCVQAASNSITKLPCLNTSFNNKRVLLLKKIKERSIKVTISDKQFSGAIDILDFIEDDYGGVIINPYSLPDASTSFAAALQFSLSHWKSKVGGLVSSKID